MNELNNLIKIASKQGGLFTAAQAVEVGYSRSNHFYHLNIGNWNKEERGLYSLTAIPKNEATFYWRLYLWTRGKNDEPQAIISHETALDLHDLSDVNPPKVYFTVPKSFRKTARTPKGLVLYKEDINRKFISSYNGFKITTPIKTLLDIHQRGSISIDLIEQAVRQALQRGLVTKKNLKEFPELLRYAI